MAEAEAQQTTIAVNRRARYDYELLQRYEAGLQLLGTEIKSMRGHQASIAEGYARFDEGELWLYNAYVAPYPPARQNHDPRRARKLLLSREELSRLARELEQNPRTTIVPLRLYLRDGRAKLEIAVGRGRRAYDKRQAIAQRDAQRTMQRALRRERR